MFSEIVAPVNDQPALLGGTEDRRHLNAFAAMANELELSACVSVGEDEQAPVLFLSAALARQLGRSRQDAKQLVLADVVGVVEKTRVAGALLQAELRHANGYRLPVLLSHRRLGRLSAWLSFDAPPFGTKVAVRTRQLAHELNNPLTSVMWKLDLLARQLPLLQKDPARAADLGRTVAEARYGVSRAAGLVREFAESVQCWVDRIEPVDLVATLEDALGLMREEIEQVASLVEEFAPVPLVYGHRSRLQQVFANLLRNAVHAVREAPLPQVHRVRVSVRLESPWVIAQVDDTGVGMSPSLQRHIFEPFMTTRASTGGSGLGLFVCQEIVESLGGRIDVKSSPLSGSSFRLRLKAKATGSDPSGPSSHRRTKPGRTG